MYLCIFFCYRFFVISFATACSFLHFGSVATQPYMKWFHIFFPIHTYFWHNFFVGSLLFVSICRHLLFAGQRGQQQKIRFMIIYKNIKYSSRANRVHWWMHQLFVVSERTCSSLLDFHLCDMRARVHAWTCICVCNVCLSVCSEMIEK